MSGASEWRTWKPGQRVRVMQTGWTGTVVTVHQNQRGQSSGAAWVKVTWDKNGVTGRVANPGMNLEAA